MATRCPCPTVSRRVVSRKYITMPGGFSYVNGDIPEYDIWVRKTGGTTYDVISYYHTFDNYHAVAGSVIDLADYDDSRIEVALSYFDEYATVGNRNKVVAALVAVDGFTPIFEVPCASGGANAIKMALLKAADMFGSARRRSRR
jgi:hypothetical protein